MGYIDGCIYCKKSGWNGNFPLNILILAESVALVDSLYSVSRLFMVYELITV